MQHHSYHLTVCNKAQAELHRNPALSKTRCAHLLKQPLLLFNVSMLDLFAPTLHTKR